MIKYLLGKASTGKFRFAIVESDEEWHDTGYVIQRSYGQVGGKTTLSPPIIVDRTKQKRTWREQLELQYNSTVKGYLDKGYIEVEKHPNEYTTEELQTIFGDVKTNQYGVIKPMLAKQADKVTNRKIFDKTWIASRKLDGVRCLLYYKDGNILTASRGGETYNYSTQHILTDPRIVTLFEQHPNIILDGELFKRFKSLQQISGAARMEKNAYDCEWLQYWIYDMYVPDMIASERIKHLAQFSILYNIPTYIDTSCDEINDHIFILNQEEVSGWDNIDKLHDQFVSEGFEGVVIRDPSRPYKVGGRTNDMIKIKHYLDDTFLIIDYELGLRGTEDMCFICQMSDGRTFKAMPIGDRETKLEYVKNFNDKYKDHLGDCKYFTLSDSGVPLQPRFLCFRPDLE